MICIDRSMASRAPTCVTLACLFGLAFALAAIGAERAGAAADSKQIFNTLDENHDGVVRREEFLRAKIEVFYSGLKDLDHDPRLSPEDIDITPEAFADADVNGDGKISGAEFVQARFTQFEAIDANGDQEITFEEFQEFIRQYRL